MMTQAYYGTTDDAASYFSERLHEYAWSNASPDDQLKALKSATKRIDALNFKGDKHSVYAALLNSEESIDAQIDIMLSNAATADTELQAELEEQAANATAVAADAGQELEFPRDADTVVPTNIVRATYEIAYALLDGKDPELAFEALATTSNAYASVRTSYNREQTPPEHVANGIPSFTAWCLLRPFLRDSNNVSLSRAS